MPAPYGAVPTQPPVCDSHNASACRVRHTRRAPLLQFIPTTALTLIMIYGYPYYGSSLVIGGGYGLGMGRIWRFWQRWFWWFWQGRFWVVAVEVGLAAVGADTVVVDTAKNRRPVHLPGRGHRRRGKYPTATVRFLELLYGDEN